MVKHIKTHNRCDKHPCREIYTEKEVRINLVCFFCFFFRQSQLSVDSQEDGSMDFRILEVESIGPDDVT